MTKKMIVNFDVKEKIDCIDCKTDSKLNTLEGYRFPWIQRAFSLMANSGKTGGNYSLFSIVSFA